MPPPGFDSERWREAVILLLIFAVFLLASPFFNWWATAARLWLLPFVIWAGVILLIYLLYRRRPDDL